jgi:hypothetical protein
MNLRIYLAATAFAAIAVTGNAQALSRKAQITGVGDRDRGKCTIEVVVDVAAEVEVRGDTATLRTLGGQAAQWRRFQCSAVMPLDPRNFRFSGIDGRGRQQLTREPRGNAPAVVRIDDPSGGSEGYTFDLEWSYGGGFAPVPPPGPPPVTREDGRRYDERDRDRDHQQRFTTEEAVRVCKDAVADQARDRFRAANVVFRRIAIDDNPGRNDWVVGTLEVDRTRGPSDAYRFSCSVNFDTGRVRSAQIDRDRLRER